MTLTFLKKPGVIKAGRILGYASFGLVVFLVSIVLTLPTDRVKSYIEGRLSTGGMLVRIDRLSMRGLLSVAAFGLHVELPPEKTAATPGGEAVAASGKREASFERVDLSLHLLPLLVGRTAVTIQVEDQAGVFGPVKIAPKVDEIEVDIKEIKDFPLPKGLPVFGVRFSGFLSGKGSFVIHRKDFSQSSGQLELTGTRIMAMKPTLKAENQPSLSLTDIDVGNLALVINMDKRSNLATFKNERKSPASDATVIQIEKASLDGKDVKVLVEAHSVIRLFTGRPASEGQMNVDFAFGLSDAFFDKPLKTATETSTPNKFLRTLLSLDPKWKNALSGGYYGVLCTGTLSKPSCSPKKPSIRGGEFKAPSKEETGAVAATPSPRPGQASTPRGSEAGRPASAATPSPTPPPTPAPNPPTPPPRATPTPPPDEPSDEPDRTEAAPVVTPAPNLVNATRPMLPTVIGRPRMRAVQEAGSLEPGEDKPAGGGEEPAPVPGSDEEE